MQKIMKSKIQLALIMLSAMLLIRCDHCDCPSGLALGELTIKLTINKENPDILVTLFEGNIEKGDTLFSEYWSDDRAYYELLPGKRYSATAHYYLQGKEIVAIDGKKMQTSYDECDCEYGEDLTFNLRLVD